MDDTVGQSTVVTDDGVRLHTRVDGRDDVRGLLLCNSLGTDLDVWEPQVEPWAATRRVVRFDQRGHGRSQTPPPPYDLERLGRDALAVLDAHDLRRADVCGESLGGLVALWLAVNAPERVRRVVLADTAARVGSGEDWRARADAVRAGGMAAVADLALERFFSAGFRAAGSPWVARVGDMLHAVPPDGYVGACLALADADLRAEVGGVRPPALVVVGTADEATPPADARELAERLPDARLVELPGAGHLAHLEAPDRFAEVVADFLAGSHAAELPQQ